MYEKILYEYQESMFRCPISKNFSSIPCGLKKIPFKQFILSFWIHWMNVASPQTVEHIHITLTLRCLVIKEPLNVQSFFCTHTHSFRKISIFVFLFILLFHLVPPVLLQLYLHKENPPTNMMMICWDKFFVCL